MTQPAEGKPDAAVRLDSVRKVYGTGDNEVVALDNVTLDVHTGTFTAVMGPSGSGKSTLLHSAAGFDRPTSGTVLLDGQDISKLSETALTKLRRVRIGFVFQAFNLLPALTVMQNITLPLELAGRKIDRERCREVAESVGLGNRLDHRPSQLSGGQQQRVAIARAMVTQPAVIFADEPTGALDTSTSQEVLGLLRDAVQTHGQTIVMVTHDPVAASFAQRVVFLVDGRVVRELTDPTPESVSKQMAELTPRTADYATATA